MPQKLLSNSLILMGLVAATGLAACSPNAFPTGYKYHNQAYKSPNPPPADIPDHKKEDVKRAQAAVKSAPEPMPIPAPQLNTAQADQLRLSVYQLAESLTRRAGMPPKAVFVMSPETQSPVYEVMGSHLRDALRHLNYRVSDIPDNAYAITYAVQPVAMAAPGQGNTEVSLLVYDKAGDGAKLLTEESNLFFIEGGETLPPVAAPVIAAPVAAAPVPPPTMAPTMSTPMLSMPSSVPPSPVPAPRPPMPGPAR